ncbi:hypothetical protein N7449_008554 [Penicillium cf. viridicatum]|uniref:Uncharacterized protein n=1 Tax=Penicillium cf. viridicatum TaxID=2972119 RepID=A0A9W9M9U5_9EURO|nr:hypothetical protein N7449_008554 [Penicillium cf. viridicatum]
MDCVGNDWLLHLLVGRDIVKEGFRVRDEIFNLAPSLSAEHNIGGECHVDFTMPFYHCGLVCISRFFIDPVWQFLGDELPLLSEETIKSHSLVALSYIEERLIKVNFESVFYLPLLMGISLEVRSSRHRHQITQLLQLIEKRGFAPGHWYQIDRPLRKALGCILCQDATLAPYQSRPLYNISSDSYYGSVEILHNATQSHSYRDNKLHDLMLANLPHGRWSDHAFRLSKIQNWRYDGSSTESYASQRTGRLGTVGQGKSTSLKSGAFSQRRDCSSND